MTVPLTAILTCRNAEATLARCLEHLAWHGARIIVIDNGSTDASRDIVRNAGDAVVELREDPFAGAFDLTHQLRLKRDIIATLDAGWVLHADADEFIDTPDGTPLTDYLAYWTDADVTAFACAEVMFLPVSEQDRHDPATFTETMQACLRIAERDPKQRVFRTSAALDHWMATGGHTVTKPLEKVPDVAFTLRHYFGLSLDQIRAEYLGRVFAPENLGKLWHGGRQAGDMTIVPPPKNLLHKPDAVVEAPAQRRVPVFQPRPQDIVEPADGSSNLELVATSQDTLDQIGALAIEMFPGLRVAALSPFAPTRRPRLLITEHPMLDCPKEDAAVAHGEAWLRGIACARQSGLGNGLPYAELRLEDLEELPGLLQHTVRRLLSGDALPPLLTGTEPIRTHMGYTGRIKAITGPLATDLGYA